MTSALEEVTVDRTTNDGSLIVEVDENGTIVLSGEIDIASGPLLDSALLECEGRRPVVLDLGRVSFIDSAGLRTLLGASRRANDRFETIRLSHVSREVSRLLELTGTAGMFDLGQDA